MTSLPTPHPSTEERTANSPTTDSPTTDSELTDLLRTQMPLCGLLDIEAVRGDRSEVVLRGAWHETRCTVAGVLHGGYLMALADSAGATCTVFNLPPGAAGTTTIESKTNLFRPVTSGAITARATPVHVGRTTVVVQTDLIRDDGKLVARTVQTQAVLGPA